jgi:hypothetical protein
MARHCERDAESPKNRFQHAEAFAEVVLGEIRKTVDERDVVRTYRTGFVVNLVERPHGKPL